MKYDPKNKSQNQYHKSIAKGLFPGLKITHAMTDALLIAEYCRRTNEF